MQNLQPFFLNFSTAGGAQAMPEHQFYTGCVFSLVFLNFCCEQIWETGQGIRKMPLSFPSEDANKRAHHPLTPLCQGAGSCSVRSSWTKTEGARAAACCRPSAWARASRGAQQSTVCFWRATVSIRHSPDTQETSWMLCCASKHDRQHPEQHYMKGLLNCSTSLPAPGIKILMRIICQV